MSQVFPFPCIGDQMALLFKDSISGTEEAVKLSDPHTTCTCMHKSKDQPVREEVPGLLTLNKFRSRCERGRFTQPMLLHAVLLPLHFAGLRRGLARGMILAVGCPVSCGVRVWMAEVRLRLRLEPSEGPVWFRFPPYPFPIFQP